MVDPEPDEKMPGLNSIIQRLLEVRGSRPGKAVQLTEQEIRNLCTYVSPSLPTLALTEPLSVARCVPEAADSTRARSSSESLRRCAWTVLRLAPALRVRGLSSRVQLLVSWRLC